MRGNNGCKSRNMRSSHGGATKFSVGAIEFSAEIFTPGAIT